MLKRSSCTAISKKICIEIYCIHKSVSHRYVKNNVEVRSIEQHFLCTSFVCSLFYLQILYFCPEYICLRSTLSFALSFLFLHFMYPIASKTTSVPLRSYNSIACLAKVFSPEAFLFMSKLDFSVSLSTIA